MNDSPVAARRNKAETNPQWAILTLGFFFSVPLLKEISPKTIPSHSNFYFKLLKSVVPSTEAAVCVNLRFSVLSPSAPNALLVRPGDNKLATSGNGILSGVTHEGVEKQVGPDLGRYDTGTIFFFHLNWVFIKDRWNQVLISLSLSWVFERHVWSKQVYLTVVWCWVVAFTLILPNYPHFNAAIFFLTILCLYTFF